MNTVALIDFPILYINDPLKGRPLFYGQIFVGIPDLDPEDGNGNPINSKQLRIVQENGTKVDVPQPFILSAGGSPVYNGKTVRLDVDGNYSLKILDKNGAQTYYIHNIFEGQPVTIDILNQLAIQHYTLTEAIALTTAVIGQIVQVTDRANTQFEYIALEASNGANLIDATGSGLTLSLIDVTNLNGYGAGKGVVTDDNIAIQAAINLVGDGGYLTCESNSSFETDVPIESTGTRVIDLLNANWKYSGTGGTVLRLQPNSSIDVVFSVPEAMTVTQSSFNPAPSELTGVSVGDILVLESDDINLVSGDGDYLKGQVVKVSKNEAGIVQFYPNIVDDFTALRIKIVGKTEGTNIKNINFDCADNVSNNGVLDLIWHSSAVLDNLNIIGSGFQNIGLKVTGVDITISNSSIVGVANNFQPLGYGVSTSGSNITVSGISGTKCRHLVDGGSRSFYTVNLSYVSIHASKGDGATDFLYILGFHANCRGFSMTNCNVSGSGNLMFIRGGEGTITGCNFISTGSNIYADITVNEEGARNIVIDGNTFTNGFGLSGNTCVRLSTAQDNDGLIISNNTVHGDDKVFVELRNNGFNTKGVLIDGNTGSCDKLLFTEDGTSPSATNLGVTISNNDFEAADSETGYYISLLNNFNDLNVTVSNNKIKYLTGSGMFGLTGDISGNLDLSISHNKTLDSDVDSYFIKPTSITGNMRMDFSHNQFSAQFEIDVVPATFSTMQFVGNQSTKSIDPILMTQADLPIVFQNNITNDSESLRNMKTLYPEAMIGNVNAVTGFVSPNLYKDHGLFNFPDGTWRADADPDSLPIDLKAIKLVLKRTYAVGQTTGWAFDGANWQPLANL